MSEGIAEASTNLQARIAGSLYVIIIVGAVFAPFPVVPSGLMRGDAAVTATKMMASKSLYSLGGAAELVVYACDIGVALIFYELLKPVSRRLALLAAFFRLAYVSIAGANVLNHFAPLLFMSGGEYLTPFRPDQLRAVAVTFIRLHTIGFDIALVFFGLHCIVAGYLFFRSSFFPRILGVLLAVGGVGYLVNISANLLPPGFGAYLFPYILAPAGIAEISLALWLLLMGVNVQRWKEQAAAAKRESL
jgi:hypothetical protein